jgi:hypothetical protein
MREWRYKLHAYVTSALDMVMSGQLHVGIPLSLGKMDRNCVGPRADLDAVEKGNVFSYCSAAEPSLF